MAKKQTEPEPLPPAETPPKRSLITVATEIEAVMAEVEAAGGELTDELEIRLSELQMEAKGKVMAVAGWVRRLDMEIEGVKMHLSEVQERKGKLEDLKDRLKNWIFKGAQIAGILQGNEKDGWQGEKVQTAELTLSWRKSEATIIEEQHPGWPELVQNRPDLFHYEVDPVDLQAGFELEDLIERGRLKLKHRTISKTRAEEAARSAGLPLAGIKIQKRINPQIKG